MLDYFPEINKETKYLTQVEGVLLQLCKFFGESTRVVVQDEAIRKSNVCCDEKGAKTLQNTLAVNKQYCRWSV